VGNHGHSTVSHLSPFSASFIARPLATVGRASDEKTLDFVKVVSWRVTGDVMGFHGNYADFNWI
jgi:hypothetical protein